MKRLQAEALVPTVAVAAETKDTEPESKSSEPDQPKDDGSTIPQPLQQNFQTRETSVKKKKKKRKTRKRKRTAKGEAHFQKQAEKAQRCGKRRKKQKTNHWDTLLSHDRLLYVTPETVNMVHKVSRPFFQRMREWGESHPDEVFRCGIVRDGNKTTSHRERAALQAFGRKNPSISRSEVPDLSGLFLVHNPKSFEERKKAWNFVFFSSQ